MMKGEEQLPKVTDSGTGWGFWTICREGRMCDIDLGQDAAHVLCSLLGVRDGWVCSWNGRDLST